MWKHIDEKISCKYEINECGELRNVNTQKKLLKYEHEDGFEYYHIKDNGKIKYLKVGELIARAFIQNPQNKSSIKFIDGNLKNYNLSNIEWIDDYNEDDEKWDVIKDFPDYEINRKGNVRNIYTKRHIGLNPNSSGYLAVNLHKDKKPYRKLIHILVAQQYIPNPENKPIVNHIDEDRANNHVENLEWVTVKENSNHGNRNEKLAKRGSRPINEYDTSGRYLRTWISASAFARHYGISTTPVFICLSGKGKTVAGRQVRYYSGSIENISSTKKTCFVIKKYDFEKPVPAEYLYVFKSKREQVMEAIEMPLKNIAMTRNTAKDNENKIKEYIISLEQEIEKLKKTLELYNYQVKTDEVN